MKLGDIAAILHPCDDKYEAENVIPNKLRAMEEMDQESLEHCWIVCPTLDRLPPGLSWGKIREGSCNLCYMIAKLLINLCLLLLGRLTVCKLKLQC